MSELFEEMLQKYDISTTNKKENAIKEIIQEIVLYSLSKAGFFSNIAFYGGTALRIFYGLDRFSEDLDFSLLVPDKGFQLSDYIPMLGKEMNSFGFAVEVSKKSKISATNIQSGFVKANTQQQLSFFFKEQKTDSIPPNQKIKIKFEVDTNPPDFAGYESRYRLLPYPYEVLLYDMGSLFAGKIHAILARSWVNRIKGRDLYDYVFYLQRGTSVNLKHLKARLIQSGHLKSNENFTIEDLKFKLINHFEQLDYSNAKQDVVPFVKDTSVLDIWSSRFFSDITNDLQGYDI